MLGALVTRAWPSHTRGWGRQELRLIVTGMPGYLNPLHLSSVSFPKPDKPSYLYTASAHHAQIIPPMPSNSSQRPSRESSSNWVHGQTGEVTEYYQILGGVMDGHVHNDEFPQVQLYDETDDIDASLTEDDQHASTAAFSSHNPPSCSEDASTALATDQSSVRIPTPVGPCGRTASLAQRRRAVLDEVQSAIVIVISDDDATPEAGHVDSPKPARLGASRRNRKRRILDHLGQSLRKRREQASGVHFQPRTPASKPQRTTGGSDPTAAQSAALDDVLTSVLIDCVGYEPKIRKNHQYETHNNVEAVEIRRIVQAYIAQPDIANAESALLSMDRVQKFYQKLSQPERMYFEGHLRRYLQIYLPECTFDITSTTRYNLNCEEASTTARCHIPRGSTIPYLGGSKIYITAEEENATTASGKDFSILYSTYKRRNYIFLGPARLVNHDCNANAKLALGGEEVEVIAMRAIEPGEEITLYYSKHYFGDDNSECLCATCEKEGLNGWAGTGRKRGDYQAKGLLCDACRKSPCRPDENECSRCKRHRDLYAHTWPTR